MNDKLNDALNQISDKHLAEAENIQKAPHRRPYWIAAVAAVLGLVIGLTAFGNFFSPAGPTGPIQLEDPTRPTFTWPDFESTYPAGPEPGTIQAPETWGLASLVAAPQYPEMVRYPDWKDHPNFAEYDPLLDAWKADQAARYNQPQGYADSLADFFRQSIPQFLSAEENSTYSPVNVYMALAMLAETTDRASRQQILDALGLETIEQLRQQVKHMWNAHYSSDGQTSLLLGNSIWLSDRYSFHSDRLQLLAENYYASSFQGEMGTDNFNDQLRQWINANTGGLLQEQADTLELDPRTAFALVSTVYFSADWDLRFSDRLTEDKSFHSYNGDTVAAYMKQSLYRTYYRGSNFGAVELDLSGENSMWLILPDEGFSVADILESDEYLRLTLDPGRWENKASGMYVHLQLPKFDVTARQDLADGIRSLGITAVFDPDTSDFSPITDEPGLYISQIDHTARVAIDEEGCVAAAFTVIHLYASGFNPPTNEIEFILDRPFLFVISSRDDLPLFAGTVVEP